MKSNTMKSCMIFLLCNIIAVIYAKQDPLIFDRSDDSIFLFPKTIPSGYATANRGEWVTACPAETQPEKNFIIENSSLKKNGLFVRKIYEKKTEASTVDRNICEGSYKLSLAYKVQNCTFQFGYEIYYKRKERSQFDEHYNPLDYQTPSEVIESMKNRLNKGFYEMKQYARIVSNAIGIGLKKLSLAGEKMEFMWLYQFKLRFDINKKILEVIWHEIQANNKWDVPENCQDYSLGAELYEEGIDLDELYTNQIGIFEDFEMLEQCCHSTTEPCLIKWSLIPIDQFSFGSDVPPVCSNIVTIPIWRGKTEKILKKLDKYLYALFRVLDEPVHVVSGIIGEHQFVNTKLKDTMPLYLDANYSRIPVPKTIYKIVEYRIKNCEMEESLCWYSVAILIHNIPDFNKFSGDKICPQNQHVTKNWGWEEITKDFDGNQSEMIYVCENDPNIQRKLSIQWKSREKSGGGLNLLKFKYSEDGGETVLEKDIKTQVDEMFRKLSNEGENNDIESGSMVERGRYQNDLFSDDSKITVDVSGDNSG